MTTHAEQDVARFLNSDSLSMLEQKWSSLPTMAYCEGRQGEWRLHILGPQSVFLQAGFKDDQPLSAAELLAYAKQTQSADLVERLLAILDHIRREPSA